MDHVRPEQCPVASGFVAIAFGATAAALERPWPTADAATFSAFIADNRGAILAQSMLFVIGAGAYVWFLGSLRSFLMKAEGGTGRLSTVAFGAGIIWAGTNVVGQAPQIALTLPSSRMIRPQSLPPRRRADLQMVCHVGLGSTPLLMFYAPLNKDDKDGRPPGLQAAVPAPDPGNGTQASRRAQERRTFPRVAQEMRGRECGAMNLRSEAWVRPGTAIVLTLSREETMEQPARLPLRVTEITRRSCC
jgi:hypothetical protein